MQKKIPLVILVFLLITGVWFFYWSSKPALTIITPQDSIAVSTYDTLSFSVKIRHGQCPEFISFWVPIFNYCKSKNIAPIERIYLTRQNDLKNLTPNDDWYFDHDAKNDNPFLIHFDKPGTYKIVAIGLFPQGWVETISAESAPITVNVAGALKWQTMGEKGLFSIQVPGEWNMTEQINSNTNDLKRIEYYNFYFFDRIAPLELVFTIIKTPKSSWNDSLGPAPLVKTSEYVFTTYIPDTPFSPHHGFTNAQIRDVLPKVFASFKSLKQ